MADSTTTIRMPDEYLERAEDLIELDQLPKYQEHGPFSRHRILRIPDCWAWHGTIWKTCGASWNKPPVPIW